uniref:Uncharacterized protein n=1 Tax=viral metagenome TaxID=1070528 RepID=A0A6M3Y0V9_9ZZZZ
MKMQLILMAISLLMKLLSPELVKKGVDYLKEKIEAYIAGTGTKVDDFILAAFQGSADELKAIADWILDFGEDYVLGTVSKIDDALVLPVFNMIRVALDIPDND